jgi:8-oxo-dGTP pyrophosphatase MutT (NUDIX family)
MLISHKMLSMEEKVLLHATVCLLCKNNQVLLALKTKKIGAGCLNGYGGGIENGESIVSAAIRELEEETGKKVGKDFITTLPEHLEKVAVIDFHNTKSDGEVFICRVHFFIVKEWSGTAVDTDEMVNAKPYNIDQLPLDNMMPADSRYFPLILSGKKIVGMAKYGPYQKELLEEPVLHEVEFLPED